MSSVVFTPSLLGVGHILISDFVVANLLVYSLAGMILLYLAAVFTPKVFLDEIYLVLTLVNKVLRITDLDMIVLRSVNSLQQYCCFV